MTTHTWNPKLDIGKESNLERYPGRWEWIITAKLCAEGTLDQK